MSKKTFSAAPKPKQQPTDDQILAFERGGAGHDTTRADKPVAKTMPDEPTKRLSLDLPASLHTRFKTACSATDRKMVGELQAFIEQRTQELEEDAGITRK
ncbi:hypothetical protein ROE7235_03467 [Roseibaca ekhonensis]|jgi:hypothetical protein|uniref:ParG n=3 Tax=Rhodobacterales TaxID=204455 RepID=A0A3B0MY93_9RHOB|nr:MULTISPECIES: hypothetical protein [Rhodobacterales]MCX7568301.1 hypothetical protein [Sulfitobacter sp. F26169L]MDD9709737.1 hypothetical protein [Seohaeicola sp. 4SK31]MDD9737949.1 hypothetical protein [Seohaeicola sp. SP36]QKS11318.1 hypothetical protein HT745_22280 [Pseudosulfitobacter pseudonitzschiae]TCP58485.1 hypothetical protein EV663_1246 [Rhodovulum bhavnagarense]